VRGRGPEGVVRLRDVKERSLERHLRETETLKSGQGGGRNFVDLQKRRYKGGVGRRHQGSTSDWGGAVMELKRGTEMAL